MCDFDDGGAGTGDARVATRTVAPRVRFSEAGELCARTAAAGRRSRARGAHTTTAPATEAASSQPTRPPERSPKRRAAVAAGGRGRAVGRRARP